MGGHLHVLGPGIEADIVDLGHMPAVEADAVVQGSGQRLGVGVVEHDLPVDGVDEPVALALTDDLVVPVGDDAQVKLLDGLVLEHELPQGVHTRAEAEEVAAGIAVLAAVEHGREIARPVGGSPGLELQALSAGEAPGGGDEVTAHVVLTAQEQGTVLDGHHRAAPVFARSLALEVVGELQLPALRLRAGRGEGDEAETQGKQWPGYHDDLRDGVAEARDSPSRSREMPSLWVEAFRTLGHPRPARPRG